jgi:uncharacterized membrane protein
MNAQIASPVIAFILLSVLPSPDPAAAQPRVDSIGTFGFTAMSSDGKVAAGGKYRWTEAGGLQQIPPSDPNFVIALNGLSADGSTVVGWERPSSFSSGKCDPRAEDWQEDDRIFSWTWTDSTGTRRVDTGSDLCLFARDISDNGVVVGAFWDTTGVVVGEVGEEMANAFRAFGSSYTDLHLDPYQFTVATAISVDGSTIVGYGYIPSGVSGVPGKYEALRWDETGTTVLFDGLAQDVSDDGSVIVGGPDGVGNPIRWEGGSSFDIPLPAGVFLVGTTDKVMVSGDGQTVVYGVDSRDLGRHVRVWTEARGDEALANLAIDSGVDISGWVFSFPTGVSKLGRIFMGFDSIHARAFRLSLGGKVEVSVPTTDTLIVAGEDFEIRWNSDGVDTLDIFYGSTSIETNLAASDSSYVWSVPADSLDRNAQIIVSSSTDPFTVADTVTVRIKGYVLTRVDKDEEYEAFDPNLHGWSFSNTASNVAPQTYADTRQFRYLEMFTSRDPFTRVGYDVDEFDPLGIVNVRQFEDYPSFVHAFGESRFYWGPPILRIYRESGLNFWKNKSAGKWGGSCSGMSISALMAFADSVRFGQTFPDIGAVSTLNNVVAATASTVPDPVREVINKLFSYWNGERADIWWDLNSMDNPRSTLATLKSVLLDRDESNQHIGYLYISNGSGSPLPTRAHAVAPIALRRTSKSPNRWDLSIYDPNRPYTIQTIKIDETANTWSYGSSYDGSGRFFVMDTHRNYFPQAVWPSSAGKRGQDLQPVGKAEGPIRLYTTDWASVQVDGSGGSIGYADSTVFGSLPEAEAVIEPTGYPSSPAWYDLPDGSYELTQTEVDGDTAYASFERGDLTYTAVRTDAAPSQTDRFAVGDGLGVVNGDAEAKVFQFSVLRPFTDEERSFRIRGLALAQNDSSGMELEVGDLLRLEGKGSDRSYGVRIRRASMDTVMVFEHDGVPMAGNAVHQLVPNWGALGDSLTIRIDDDGDGVFEDSLLLANTATAIEGGPAQGGASVPNEFRLQQNYPNPFNPTTTVSYALPGPAEVMLTVYDVLGRQARVLALGPKPAGVHEVVFDATGLPSGIYFYRLQAGDYVETRRMVLVK